MGEHLSKCSSINVSWYNLILCSARGMSSNTRVICIVKASITLSEVFNLCWETVWTLALFPMAESGLKGCTVNTKVRDVGPTRNSSSSPVQWQQLFDPYCQVHLLLGHDKVLLFRVIFTVLLTTGAYELTQQRVVEMKDDKIIFTWKGIQKKNSYFEWKLTVNFELTKWIVYSKLPL